MTQLEGTFTTVTNGGRMSARGFRSLLEQVAEGWSSGDPRLAAEAFAQDAVYIEPPNRQRYCGREELYAFFHGPGDEPRPMRMTWHGIAFDEERQSGFGEYTFQRPELQLHGIVTVSVERGRIASWREYQYRSDRLFEDFAGDTLRDANGGDRADAAVARTLAVPAHDGPSVWAFGGDRYTIKASAQDTAGALGLIEALIPPGSGPPRHLHRNEDEIFYLVEGELELTMGDEVETLHAGAMALLPRGVPHSFRNVGDRTSTLLLMFLPGGFERLFVDVGVPVSAGPAPAPSDYPAEVAKAMRVAVDDYAIEFV